MTKKRIPCPFCNELILPDAKKCRFCNEFLKSSKKIINKNSFYNKKISIRLSYWLWIISCIIFLISFSVISINSLPTLSEHFSLLILLVMGLAVIVGLISFTSLLITTLGSLNTTQGKWYGVALISIIFLFFALLFNQNKILALFGFTTTDSKVSPSSPSLSKSLGPDEVVLAVNHHRQLNKLDTFLINEKLTVAAKKYAQDMCSNNYFLDKNNTQNKKYTDFINDVNYSYHAAAATINEGFYDETSLLKSWIENPTTNEILTSQEYTETGVGIVRCGLKILNKTTDVIVQIFAKPKTHSSNSQQQTGNIGPNTIRCTGPDGKTFQTTEKECIEFNEAWNNAPTPNSNEIIKCNIHPNCGGGFKEMTRISCDEITCCKLLSGESVLTSKKECENRNKTEVSKQCYDTYQKILDSGLENCRYLHKDNFSGYNNCSNSVYNSYYSLIEICK